MSALGQKRTLTGLFDHLVGASEHRVRHGETKRLGRLEIDGQIVLVWRLHWQIGRLLALEDTIDVVSRAPILVDCIGPVGDQATTKDELAIRVDRGQSMLRCKRNDLIPMNCSSAYCHHQPAVGVARECGDAAFDL